MNSTELAQSGQQQALDRLTFTDEQIALIRSQIAPQAKPDELALFLYQCRRTGLDPMARQMYCIHRGGKMTIQTSIDGFRVVAERSGDYAGQDAPEYLYSDSGSLIACRVTVHRFRGDTRYPAAVGVAYMAEYNGNGPMWQKMPHAMLAKCAEALALRKAYPQDLSGLYTGDEMEQADSREGYTPVEDEHVARGKRITDEALSALSVCNSASEIAEMESSVGGGDWLHRVERYREAKKHRLAAIDAEGIRA